MMPEVTRVTLHLLCDLDTYSTDEEGNQLEWPDYERTGINEDGTTYTYRQGAGVKRL